MNPGLEKRGRHRCMQMVRRDDCHCVDAIVFARGFCPRHLAPVRVTAGNAGFFRARPGALCIGRQGARHQFEAVVKARGDPVHRADERALPAAHHA
jgi:hypothetical protein